MAESEAEDKAALKLIRSDGAPPLLLGREELAPWVEPMLECTRDATGGTLDIRARMKPKKRGDAVREAMYAVAAQAAAAILTKKRLRRLLRDVMALEADVDPADRATAAGLDGLSTLARGVVDPGESQVLTLLCLWSAIQLPEFSHMV